MVKTVLSLFIGVIMLGTLASCMDDPITGPEGEALTIFRPNSIGFRFLDHIPGSPTGSIRVYWSNSSSDTKPNFGGYVVRLLGVDTIMVGNTPIGRTTQLAQKVVGKTVFEAVFDDVPLYENYIFAVWGMRNFDPAKPDSLILSRDSMAIPKPVIFDPRPLQNPTAIRAASVNPTTVLLQWDLPPTDAQGNVRYYSVFYRDPSRLNDSAKFLRAIEFVDTGGTIRDRIEVPVPAATGQGISTVKEYEFWVKAIRTDSMQFYDDSTLIRWSGGERLTLGRDSIAGGVQLGKAIFIGNIQGRYGVQEREASDAKAWIKFEDAGENVTLTGLQGTRFFATYHGVSTLDTAIFSSPIPEASFDQETLTLPKNTPAGGWMIYARLFGNKGEPVRLWLHGVSNQLVTSTNNINIDLIYQPETSTAPLPYF
jgi:hypothetical protein